MSEAEKTVSAALVEGEELVWFGRPNGGIRGGGFFVLLVAIAACVLALGVTVFRLGPPYLLPICWVTVLGVLLYFVFGRGVVAEIRKGRTFYGLTPRRAIIVFGVFNRHVHSIELASLRDISLLEGPEHVGTILLGAPPTGSNARPAGLRGMFWPGPEPHASRAFLTIDGARTVYDRLMEQQRKCGAG